MSTSHSSAVISTAPALKRRRAGKPKAKTGCVTCKMRRVKCDEGRPECLRCQKFGIGFCDGYQIDSIHLRKTKARPLAPYPALPALQKFQNDDELRSFRLYCDEVAPRLSFSKSIWKRLLLQAGQDQQFIQHGIIAIGGLCKSLKIMGTNSIRIPGTHKPLPCVSREKIEQDSSHARVQEFALRHYGIFLRGVKEHMAIAKPDQGLRTALIACLLVYCVENMQLHHREAIVQAQNGFRLMAEFLEKPRPGNQLTSSSLIPQSVFVEDEIVRQFKRLDLSILAISDLRTPKDHQNLKDDGLINIKTMPSTFKTTEDADVYLEVIMRRSFGFISLAFSKSIFLTYAEPTEVVAGSLPGYTPCSSSSIKDPNTTHGSSGLRQSTSTDVPSSCLSRLLISSPHSTQVQQEIYASENRRWQQAFESLSKSKTRDLNQPEALQVLLLMICSTSLTVRLAGQLSTTELVYDHYMPEFKRIIHWSSMILDHPSSDIFFRPGSFILDMGLIYHVLTTALSCRDRNLRRQAIALLKRKSWREAQWGSDSAAAVAIFIMEIEEEGIETDFIPESARARMCGVEVSEEARSVWLHCLQGPRESAIHRVIESDWSMTSG